MREKRKAKKERGCKGKMEMREVRRKVRRERPVRCQCVLPSFVRYQLACWSPRVCHCLPN